MKDDVRAILAAHLGALAAGKGVLKDGRRSRVTRVEHGGRTFCVKEYRTLGWLDRAKDWFRGSRARRAWNAARLFAERGIATPEPVALVERAGAACVVTRYIEGSVPLDRLLVERFHQSLAPAELAAKRSMLRELGRWLRRVHDLGVYHDDWSTKNILTVERPGGWQFYLLDLDSVVPLKRLTERRRVKNLGQLSDAPFGITRTDRMRFLVAYAGGDRARTRGRFPRQVLAAARRRDEDWARVLEKTRRRKAKQREV